MIPSPILCLPLLLPAADSIEDLYARFGGGFSSTSSEDFQSPETLQESGDEGLLKQLLLTFDPSIDFEGHSIHFALGEKLTDQFSFEWEVQSLNMDLDSFNPQSNGFSVDGRSGLFYNFFDPTPADPDNPAPTVYQVGETSGTFSALALTANLHFEHNFTSSPFGVYGGLGVGFSKNKVEISVSQNAWSGGPLPDNDLGDPVVTDPVSVDLASSEEWDFCWHWRAGIQYQIDRKSTFYVGWRAADYGTADLQGVGPSLTADTIEFGFQQTF